MLTHSAVPLHVMPLDSAVPPYSAVPLHVPMPLYSVVLLYGAVPFSYMVPLHNVQLQGKIQVKKKPLNTTGTFL